MNASLQNWVDMGSGWASHRAPPFKYVESKILSLFQQNEFHHVRTLDQELADSLNMVCARLTDVLAFSLQHTLSIPHQLTEELKVTRVKTSIEMLVSLQQQEPTNFARVITGDVSRLFLEYSRNHGWRLGDENAPERISQQMDTEKHVHTMFWSISKVVIEK
jgi:hypothetical protein